MGGATYFQVTKQHNIAETSLGVVTIRAFNKADKFFQNYIELIDTDARLSFYSNASLEWLVLRIEAFQNLTLFTLAFLLVLLPKGYVSPGKQCWSWKHFQKETTSQNPVSNKKESVHKNC